jgi:hypothetical protein
VAGLLEVRRADIPQVKSRDTWKVLNLQPPSMILGRMNLKDGMTWEQMLDRRYLESDNFVAQDSRLRHCRSVYEHAVLLMMLLMAVSRLSFAGCNKDLLTVKAGMCSVDLQEKLLAISKGRSMADVVLLAMRRKTSSPTRAQR